MSFVDWALALHVLSAFAYVGGIVLFWVLVVAVAQVDTAEVTLRMEPIVTVGSALSIVLMGALAVRIEARLCRDVGIGSAHDLRIGMLILEVEELQGLRIDGELFVDGEAERDAAGRPRGRPLDRVVGRGVDDVGLPPVERLELDRVATVDRDVAHHADLA